MAVDTVRVRSEIVAAVVARAGMRLRSGELIDVSLRTARPGSTWGSERPARRRCTGSTKSYTWTLGPRRYGRGVRDAPGSARRASTQKLADPVRDGAARPWLRRRRLGERSTTMWLQQDPAPPQDACSPCHGHPTSSDPGDRSGTLGGGLGLQDARFTTEEVLRAARPQARQAGEVDPRPSQRSRERRGLWAPRQGSRSSGSGSTRNPTGGCARSTVDCSRTWARN